LNKSNSMTQGRILPHIFRFAFPLLLTSVLQQTYSMADAVIIKRLAGLDGFAAIGSTGSILWIIESMLMGLSHGFGVVFAQIAGSEREKESLGAAALRAGQLTLSLAFAASIGFLLFSDAILAVFQTPVEILPQASAYLKSMTPFLCMAALFQVAAALLRASGSSAIPLKAMFVSTLVNIALDYVLIRFAGLGVAGAGLATGIAQGLAFGICLRKCGLKPALSLPKGMTLRLLKMGVPSLLRDGIISCGGGIVQSTVNSFGIHVIAGVAASKKYFSILQMCGSALEGTAATFVGQNTGARQYERIRKGMRIIFVLTIASSLLTATLTFVFADGMIRLLLGSETPQVLASGVKALRWAAAFLPVLYMLCVVRAALQNMGHAVISMISGFMELAGRVAAVAALPALIGETTAYTAEEAGWAIAAAYLVIAYFIKIRQLKKTLSEP